MSSTRRNILFLVLVALLVGAAVYFIVPPAQRTKLGLDLQGGLAVILEAQDSARAPRTEEGMNKAIGIINDRVNRLGVAEAEIQRQGDWKVSVQLPGIENPDQALAVIGRTAVLEMYDVTKQFGKSFASEADALKAAGVTSSDQLPSDKRIVLWPGSENGRADAWYLITTPPPITGTDLSQAQVGFDQNNRPKVDFQLKGDGATKFAELTDELAKRGQITGQDQLLAIVLDGTVESAPRVLERIDGGRVEITGNFTLQEAKDLALVLQTGALPIELQVVDQRSVGATLGKESLRQALVAGGIGLILVLLFMIVYYRILGLIADIALLMYGALLWGALNAIGATLTLPGIAGIILTLGMAVDANVIIFARVKEEVAAGKTVRTAIDTGFRKALRAIIDANVTTVITAVVLFFTATGGVRGFALTLGLGVVLSMFTAVAVTRSILVVLGGTGLFRNVSLLGVRQRVAEKSA